MIDVNARPSIPCQLWSQRFPLRRADRHIALPLHHPLLAPATLLECVCALNTMILGQ